MMPLLLIAENKETIKNYLQTIDKIKDSVIIYLQPLQSTYSINQIRELRQEASIYQPKMRTYILQEFDRSSLEAQNAFLKLLEEPPKNVLFILTVSSIYSILPTIISRTKIIKLEKKEALPIKSSFIKTMESLLAKNEFSLIDFEVFTIRKKEEALEIINQLLIFFRNRLSTDKKAADILREIIKVADLINHNNVNPQLTVDHLLIFIAKKYSIKI